jgi:[ribosomal protein S5]-alanine N-acetyltransferase
MEDIVAGRVRLRELTKSDAPFIFELLNTEGWLRYIGDRNVGSLQDSEVFIEGIQQRPNMDYIIIEELDSNKAVGIISYIHRPELEAPDLGFAILPQFSRKGLAYEASTTFVKHTMQNEKPDKILAITMPHNRASIGLLEKIGFVFISNIQKDDETLLKYSFKNPES